VQSNLPIDLRSDTVTRPTAEMRSAMASAEVGDDVYGEDPTVERLQERAAALLGREAGLFVPSGTMGNQIAVKLHTRPGQEVITEARSHVYNYEMAAMAAISGVLARPVAASDGVLTWERIAGAIAPEIYYRAQTGLLAIENTHNMAGGTVYTQAQIADVCARAHSLRIPVHLDGARIFNASTALNVDPAALTASADSVMFCLSKGLGAPVGSMLVGSRGFVAEARSVRKMLGGGMRQVGVLAAAGLVALEKMVSRLGEDHENARELARRLATCGALEVNPDKIRTNIVIAGIEPTGVDTRRFALLLKESGVLVGTVDARTIRLLTHYDVTREQVRQAAETIARTAETCRSGVS